MHYPAFRLGEPSAPNLDDLGQIARAVRAVKNFRAACKDPINLAAAWRQRGGAQDRGAGRRLVALPRAPKREL